LALVPKLLLGNMDAIAVNLIIKKLKADSYKADR
jgi:hypothetical protein